MKTKSIRTRLTLWYFAVLALALVLFAAGMWLAMRNSLYHAVDDTLRDRVVGIAHFIEQQGESLPLEALRLEFREHSVLGPGGDLFQVAEEGGNWLYRSDPFYDERMPIYEAAEIGSGKRFETIEIQGTPLRLLSQNTVVSGRQYTVQVAAPLSELNEGIADFFWTLCAAVPVFLAVAGVGGYWLSRRALAPVDEITRTARSISAQNLSARLAVPATGDELQRLSETLNDMIQRLDFAFRKVTQFTADASHELRTPVTLMRTISEIALRKERSETEYREALEQIYMELDRTSRLIENLMMLARADSGSDGLQREPMDLATCAREAAVQGEMLARLKGAAFQADLPLDDGVSIHGDPQAIRRLFLILIDNAVKYTPEGGRICLSLSTTSGEAVAEVCDTGVGISKDDLPHIFERFYRADKARSKESGGTGLGLAIAQWIVQAHGGKIAITSEPRQGTRCRFTIPLVRDGG
ncbi:MAG: HAMP domain-containing protein [Bryobacteraceae bacterium]|nr:HAMP domain-containing protein [Bryobacteraceae bacterium]